MKILLLTFYLFSVAAQIVESVIETTGYVGGSAVIRCSYDSGYEGYSKYLCRGSCPRVGGKDIPIRTEEGQTKAVNGRFSLHDDTTARVFTVAITGLTAQDSGQYWCGVKTGFGKSDVYIEVKLKVLPAQVVTERPKVITTTEVTDGPSTATDTPSTTPFGITSACQDYEHNCPKDSHQATISFDVLVSSIAAGIVAFMILMVVLGCYAAKRNKRLEISDELPLSRSSCDHANTCSETGTTREENVYAINLVYEGLNLKQCSPEAEYGRLGTLACGGGPPLVGATGWSCPGQGAEKGLFSMKDTFSKGAENEYDMGAENEYDTLECAGKGAENEYESMNNTLRCPRKGAGNEYHARKSTETTEYEHMK